MKRAVISLLMRLYPETWRNEYGVELREMLDASPLTRAVAFDVARSAVWQRMRATQVTTWVGLSLMLAIIGAITANIVDPPPYMWAPGQSISKLPRLADQVELVQRPMRSTLFVLVMAGVGFWTAFRRNRQPGRVAMRVWLIASIPLVALGGLLLTGVLGYIELLPGQTPMPFDERGLVYVVYQAPLGLPVPAPVAFLLSPLLGLPGACLWTIVGSSLGRRVAGWYRPSAPDDQSSMVAHIARACSSAIGSSR
jgi:hypothetical protein